MHIVAIADISTARRERAQADLPGVRVYKSYEELLANETGRICFVDICTPPSSHYEIAQAAIERGLHVLCEKPLATTAAAGRALLAQARSRQRVLYPCHNYKYAPVLKRVRAILDAGTIGRVSLLTLHTLRHTHARGTPEWRPDWRRERCYSGGGIGMDHGSHSFYLACDWLAAEPLSVTAKLSTSDSFDTEDNFTGAITFPTGLATVHLAWNAGMRRVLYSIHGTLGAILVLDDQIETVVRSGAEASTRDRQIESVQSHWMDAGHAPWFRSLFVDFASAVAAGDWAGREAETAVRCVELISTAYASAGEGSRELALPPAIPL